MNKLDDLKYLYEHLEVSDKLDETIKQALEKERNNKVIIMKKINKAVKVVGAVAASFVIFVSVGTNINASCAQALYKVPVVEKLAHLVTFREYNIETEVTEGTVKIPAVEGAKQDIQDKINNIVKAKVDELVKEQEQLDKEYKEAYLETGGKEEEFKKIETKIDYKIGYSNNQYVSFEVYKTQTLASAYNENFYYTFDINTGKQINLQDIMGDKFSEVESKIITEMKDRMKADDTKVYEVDYFKENKIDKNRTFYIDKEGNIVVTFAKYEVACGAMGVQEFIVGRVN